MIKKVINTALLGLCSIILAFCSISSGMELQPHHPFSHRDYALHYFAIALTSTGLAYTTEPLIRSIDDNSPLAPLKQLVITRFNQVPLALINGACLLGVVHFVHKNPKATLLLPAALSLYGLHKFIKNPKGLENIGLLSGSLALGALLAFYPQA